MNVLAVSGSLRAASINSAFCRAAVRLAPATPHVSLFTGVGDLPLFNPDLESSPPPEVQGFRAAVGQASACHCKPRIRTRYFRRHENALDWLVSCEGFVHKPLVLINTAPRAERAYASLREILKTMSASILCEPSITLALPGTGVTEESILASAESSKMIRDALAALASALAEGVGVESAVASQPGAGSHTSAEAIETRAR